MSRFVYLWPTLLAAALILPSAATARHARRAAVAISVTAVRFSSLSDVTRIAVEVNGQFKFRSERVPNPDRVYFDIAGARSRVAPKGTQAIAVNDARVKQIRVAQTQMAVTRIVLDLEGGAEVSASRLTNPDRLMVEVRLKGPAPKAEAAPVTAQPAAARPATTRRAVARRFLAPEPVRLPTDRVEPIPVPPAVAMSYPLPHLAPGTLRAVAPPRRARPRVAAPPAEPAGEKVARTAPPPSAPEPAAAPRTQANDDSVAKPATRNSDGQRSMTRVLGLKVGRIVIDAGHGGHDHGTAGRNGLLEKDVVLDVARRLSRLVSERLGSEVILTRSDDTFIPLERRTQIANEHRADLFLSIHANSSPIRAISGAETFYLNFSTSKADLDVAARENASSQKSVYELKDLLQKIALQDKVEESREFASRIQTALYAFSSRSNSRLRNRGVKKAPFVVLIGAQMPSILAEIGFISNSREESQLARPDYRQKVAEALFKGLSQYAETLSHFQIAQKNSR
jgi:N-acetylmuramoyl-L-alanine amidase